MRVVIFLLSLLAFVDSADIRDVEHVINDSKLWKTKREAASLSVADRGNVRASASGDRARTGAYTKTESDGTVSYVAFSQSGSRNTEKTDEDSLRWSTDWDNVFSEGRSDRAWNRGYTKTASDRTIAPDAWNRGKATDALKQSKSIYVSNSGNAFSEARGKNAQSGGYTNTANDGTRTDAVYSEAGYNGYYTTAIPRGLPYRTPEQDLTQSRSTSVADRGNAYSGATRGDREWNSGNTKTADRTVSDASEAGNRRRPEHDLAQTRSTYFADRGNAYSGTRNDRKWNSDNTKTADRTVSDVPEAGNRRKAKQRLGQSRIHVTKNGSAYSDGKGKNAQQSGGYTKTARDGTEPDVVYSEAGYNGYHTTAIPRGRHYSH